LIRVARRLHYGRYERRHTLVHLVENNTCISKSHGGAAAPYSLSPRDRRIEWRWHRLRVAKVEVAVMNRPEALAVANALASLCLRLVAIILALMLGLALALAIIFALAIWYFFPALVPRQ
jgi:hypothetical protein